MLYKFNNALQRRRILSKIKNDESNQTIQGAAQKKGKETNPGSQRE